MKPTARLFALAATALLTLAPSLRGQGTPTVTTLHSFTGTGTDGQFAFSQLLQGSDGYFYGMTQYGGTGTHGTVFSITPTGVYTTLHNFTATGTDGSFPEAALVQGSDGNFYGTTPQGGGSGNGTIFSITPDGIYTTLHSFANSVTDGGFPRGALVIGLDANFYGITTQGGANADGTVFSMTPAGVVSVLYSFTGGADGSSPSGRLAQGSDGTLYGTTSLAGSSGHGTVFSLTLAGVFTALHSFTATGTDGATPYTGVIAGSDGNFYGTTFYGGVNGVGTVFSITPAGAYATLYSFAGGPDGANPQSVLAQGSDGNFYGTAVAGGGFNDGTAFQITPAGVFTTLHSFGVNSSDGVTPRAGLVQGSDGNFYGTTFYGGTSNSGTVFKLSSMPSPGALAFAAASVNTTENAGSVTLTVQRTGGSAGAVSVNYTDADGTAFAGLDYRVTSGTLNWADGDAADKTITVPINDRGLGGGGTVSFTVNLTNPGGATLGPLSTASVNIVDNDAASTPTPTPTATPTPTVAPPPTLAIVSPPDGVTVVAGSALPLAASVVDPGGILSSVQFLVNGALVDTTSATAPYLFDTTAPATAGAYTIAAIATDTLGRTSTRTITLNVIAPVAGTTPPAATLLTPVAGRNLAAGATVALDFAVAADPTTTLSQVTLYADGQPIATFDGEGNPIPSAATTGRPTRRDAPGALAGTLFQTNYTLPGTEKLVNLVAVALDKLGQSTVSAATTVHATVSDHAAPVVALGGIVSGMNYAVGSTTTVSVAASASAAQAVARPGGPVRADASATLALLEYYLNGHKIAQATQPPFSFDFTPPSAGIYVLHAVATDSTELATVSAPVVVQADAPPTVSVAAGSVGVVVEGAGKGLVVFTRAGDLGADLTVSYKVKGAAKPGVDFKPVTGTVVIPAGSAKAKLKLKTLAGAAFEGTRVAKVVLLPAADGHYVLGTAAVAKVKFVSAP